MNGKDVESVYDVQETTKGMSAGDKVIVTVIRSSSDSSGYFGNIVKERSIDLEIILTESTENR